MTTWPTKPLTLAEFNSLKKQGRVGNRQKGDKAKEEIENIIKQFTLDGDYDKEFKFSKDRKFRFDFAIFRTSPNAKKIGIEYDGLMSNKSRHTTVTGFTTDCDKTNLAQIEGWKVLRYTALNYKNLRSDLEKLL